MVFSANATIQLPAKGTVSYSDVRWFNLSAFKTADIQVAAKHISGVDSGISDWFSSQHFMQVCSVHLLQISNGACGWEWGYSTLCAAELMGLSTFHKPHKSPRYAAGSNFASEICLWVYIISSLRGGPNFSEGASPYFAVSMYQFQGKTILRSPFLLWQVPLSSVLSTLVNSLVEPDFRVQVWLHETNRSRPWLKVSSGVHVIRLKLYDLYSQFLISRFNWGKSVMAFSWFYGTYHTSEVKNNNMVVNNNATQLCVQRVQRSVDSSV